MTSAPEVEVERLEGGRLEDAAQSPEGTLPGLRLLRPVPAGERLQLGNQAGAVVLDSGAKALDRDQHRTRLTSRPRSFMNSDAGASISLVGDGLDTRL